MGIRYLHRAVNTTDLNFLERHELIQRTIVYNTVYHKIDTLIQFSNTVHAVLRRRNWSINALGGMQHVRYY